MTIKRRTLPREVRELFDAHKVTIERCRAGKHIVMRCRTHDGQPFTFTVGKSPTDHRALKNARSNLRKVIANSVT